jgi:hypothetical protein
LCHQLGHIYHSFSDEVNTVSSCRTLIRAAIEKCLVVLLEGVYDFQTTNRRQGGCSNILGGGEGKGWGARPRKSTEIPDSAEYTKISTQTSGCSYVLIENSPKATFIFLTVHISFYNVFVRNVMYIPSHLG